MIEKTALKPAGNPTATCPRCGLFFRFKRFENHWRTVHGDELPWTSEELIQIEKSAGVGTVEFSSRKPRALDEAIRKQLRNAKNRRIQNPVGTDRSRNAKAKKKPKDIIKSDEIRKIDSAEDLSSDFMRKCCGRWFRSKTSWEAHRKSTHAKRHVRKKGRYEDYGEGNAEPNKKKEPAKGIFGSLYSVGSGVAVSGGLPGLGKRR
ncbi:MAG: hypothetical protein ACT4P0_04990 [Panacagrimonas sp.]